MLLRRNFGLLAFCVMQSLIVPAAFLIFGVIPAHDSRAKLESWFVFANSLSLSGQPPLWIPNWDEGVNSTFISLSFNGIDYLMILLVNVFSMEFPLVFALYVFINSLLSTLTIAVLFKLLRINENWTIAYITINACTVYAWWQVYFNLLGVQRLLLALTVVIALRRFPSSNSFWAFIGYTFVIVPYGYINYFVPVYISMLSIFVIGGFIYIRKRQDKNSRKVLRYDLICQNKPWMLFVLFSSIFSIIFFLQSVLIFTFDSVVLTPGRTNLGFSTLNNQLEYGGNTGTAKLVELLGLNWTTSNTNPDLMLILGPVFSIFVMFSIYYVKKIKLRAMIFLLRMIFVIALTSIPFVPLVSLLYFSLPGFAFLRHLSSLAVLLIPLLVLFVSIVWTEIEKRITNSMESKTEKKNSRNSKVLNKQMPNLVSNSHTFAFWLLGSLFIIVSSIVFFETVRQDTFSRDNALFYLILFAIQASIFFIATGRKGIVTTTQSHESARRIPYHIKFGPHLFLVSALLAIYSKAIPQYDYGQINSNNYLSNWNLDISRTLPIERNAVLFGASPNRSPFNAGAEYVSKNSVTARDNCGSQVRKDIVSKAILMSAQKQGALDDMLDTNFQRVIGQRCVSDKSKRIEFIDRFGKPLNGEYKFVNYNYNYVKIRYDVKLEERFEFLMVFRDAYSNANLWRASLNGEELKISVSTNGYKSVKLQKESGNVVFEIKKHHIAVQQIKILLDIIWILTLFTLLVHFIIFRGRSKQVSQLVGENPAL